MFFDNSTNSNALEIKLLYHIDHNKTKYDRKNLWLQQSLYGLTVYVCIVSYCNKLTSNTKMISNISAPLAKSYLTENKK